MNSYLDASELFKTSFNTDDFFETINASYVRSNLVKALDDDKCPLIFLLGDPGVGKTYMLNIIQEKYKSNKKILFSSDPLSSPESLLYFLLEDNIEDKQASIGTIKDKVISIYKNIENIIILDEAQLLNTSTLEYIRVLSDTGYFKFIISMHKKEGEDILKKKHFSSRPHIILTLEKLEKNEILKYIQAQLFKNSFGEVANLFTAKQTKELLKHSNGNFRMLKQLVKHILLIMNYAKENGIKKYTKPNKCVITMSAIDLGYIDV